MIRKNRTLLLVLAGFLLAALGFAEPAPLPPGMGKYIMVLREPDEQKDSPTEITEPNIPLLGGEVLESYNNKRIILLPLTAAPVVQADKSVAYLQRVWMGEPLETWNEPAGTSQHGKVASDTETNLSWASGTYLYDGSGNIKSIGNDTYTYDSAGRLIKAVVNNQSETYKYDSFGNLKEKAIAGYSPTIVPIEPTNNRLSGESYDAIGNVTTNRRNTSEQYETYTYDSMGMMNLISSPFFNQNKRMIYTADDERIGIQVDASFIRWKIRDVNGSEVIREFVGYESGYPGMESTWEWVEDYVYGEGRLIGGEREAYYGGKRHFHLDHLGSVRMITGDSRMRYGRHDYYPFGTEQTLAVQESTNFGYERPDPTKFTSHERDFHLMNVDDTQYLDYMHARFYNPAMGRFLSVDPVLGDPEEPQSWNRYSYVTNNPINFTDPSGMCGEPADFVGPTLPCDIDFAEEIEVTAEAPGIFEGIGFIANETTAQITPFGPLPGSTGGLWSAYQDRQFLKANPNWKPDTLSGVVVVGPLTQFRISNLRYLQGGRLLRGNVTESGGVSAARAQFERLTGRPPIGATDSAKLPDGTVVKFRAVGRSGGAKVEINDPVNRTYQKTTFND